MTATLYVEAQACPRILTVDNCTGVACTFSCAATFGASSTGLCLDNIQCCCSDF